MSSKTPKSKPKVMDVTKAKKAAPDNANEQLVINSRQIVGRDMKPATPDNDPPSEPASAPPLAPSRRKVIVPIDADVAPEPDKQPASSQAPEPEKNSKQTSAKETEEESAPPPDPTPEAPQKAPTTAPKKEESEDSAPVQPDAPESPTTDEAKPTPETQKAVEEAAQAAERERELEALIDSRKYNVPIDVVARKRSIKVSLGLTLLTLFLAAVLIDLMLDSGMVLLVQKIPHTHFFSVNSSNN